jgi:cystine transport system substrate-binding protein
VLRRVAIGAVLTAALIAAVSASAAGPADEAEQQRAVLEDLQAGEEQALVDLFAADSALGRAEERAQRLEERLAGVRDRVDETQRSLEISQSNLLVARKLLNERIEQWYRMDQIDAIEIILGSDSLSDVIDQFDAIERMSSRDADVVRGTRDFAAETKERQRSLQDQEQQVEQLVAAARAEADRLAAARATKEALVSDLRRQASLTSSRIERLDQAAQEAAARAEAIQAEQAASAGGSPTADPARSGDGGAPDAGGGTATPPPDVETPPPGASGGQQITVSATAYSIHGTTASGLPTAYGVCATDPSVIPMGTRFSVPGYGTCVAGDTGSAIIGNTIDVWFPELSQAQAWGRQSVTVTILG